MINKKRKSYGSQLKAMYSRYANRDTSGLTSEEVLALLLSYTVPSTDTRSAAKRLLAHFGSLSSVMEAESSDLARVIGCDEYAASIINMLPKLSVYYHIDKLSGGRNFSDIQTVAEYCVYLFMKDTRESYSVFMLDSSMRMLGIEKLAEGSACHVGISLDELGDILFRYNCSSFVFVHNHPGRAALPSESDLSFTNRIYSVTAQFGKIMLEHLIIAGNKYFPVMQNVRSQGYDFTVDC